jgi:hypothetical protein
MPERSMRTRLRTQCELLAVCSCLLGCASESGQQNPPGALSGVAGTWELELATSDNPAVWVRGTLLMRDSIVESCPTDIPNCTGLAAGTHDLNTVQLLGSQRSSTVFAALSEDGRIMLELGGCCDRGELTMIGTLESDSATGRWYENSTMRERAGAFRMRKQP